MACQTPIPHTSYSDIHLVSRSYLTLSSALPCCTSPTCYRLPLDLSCTYFLASHFCVGYHVSFHSLSVMLVSSSSLTRSSLSLFLGSTRSFLPCNLFVHLEIARSSSQRYKVQAAESSSRFTRRSKAESEKRRKGKG